MKCLGISTRSSKKHSLYHYWTSGFILKSGPAKCGSVDSVVSELLHNMPRDFLILQIPVILPQHVHHERSHVIMECRSFLPGLKMIGLQTGIWNIMQSLKQSSCHACQPITSPLLRHGSLTIFRKGKDTLDSGLVEVEASGEATTLRNCFPLKSPFNTNSKICCTN